MSRYDTIRTGLRRGIETARRPEYTGENRCTPCTVTNVGIAGVASLAVARRSRPAAAALFAGSLGAIYLRGYLVPGTPTLTARYFPDWLLRLFEKGEGAREVPVAAGAGPDEEPVAVDVEALLVEAGVLAADETADDLVLVPEFAEAWTERMVHLAGGSTGMDRETLADLLDVSPDRVTLERHGREAIGAYVDDEYVARWESRAAFVADMAATREIERRVPDWSALPLYQRSQVLGGLRLFVERCPVCNGTVSVGQRPVRSCCREWEVIAVSCEDCGARLLEIDRDTSAAVLEELDAAGEHGDVTGARDDATRA